MTYSIIILRHGESVFTEENKFCGWYDSPLSEKGQIEAKEAGQMLKSSGYKFDIAFTSQLSRAQVSLNTIINELGQTDIEIVKAWQLNERHYGYLTGMNKQEAVDKYGFEQVHIWRRSFDVLPPPMTEDHKFYKIIKEQVASYDRPAECEPIVIPQVESLKTTMERVIPYWSSEIIPQLTCGKRVLICTHGTSCRSIIKHLDQIPDGEIIDLNIPTGIPFLYEFDSCFKPLKSMQFFGDSEKVKKAIEKAKSVKNRK